MVEDEPATRAVLVEVFRRLGHDPQPAATVAEAQALVDGQALAVLDIDLPDGRGTAVLRQIRSAGWPMRVVIASGTTDEGALDEARRLGADLILRKPIDVAALVAVLNEALETGGS